MQLPTGSHGPLGIADKALAPDYGLRPVCERISISPMGRLWAISHGGSYLGYAPSSEEAARIGRHLADWFIDQGREAAVVIDAAPLAGRVGGLEREEQLGG